MKPVPRVAKILLAVAVAGAACWLINSNPPDPNQGPDPSPPTSVPALEISLRQNTVNPYRWLELAEGYEQAGDSGKARVCFHRAEELGTNIAPVWIRSAGFHFRLGESEAGLRAGVRAQTISDGADEFLFQYYDRFVPDTPLVIRSLAAGKRTLLAYMRHLMANRRADDAETVWQELKRRGFADRELAIAYVEFLLVERRYEAAESELGEGRSVLSPVFHAAHAVITQLRLIDESNG